MAWVKRIFLFMITNILIIATISIILRVTGLDKYMMYYGQGYGLDYGNLLVFCFVWGMAGSFISLLVSKPMAKWMMGVKVIDPMTTDANARQLVQVVHNLARGAGISKMPQVGVYQSPEVNAFATGATKNSSLVAVSSGLLQRMNKEQLEGVLGHEVAHIANGDMVTMTLLQGIVNVFVMFFARVFAHLVSSAMSKNSDRGSDGMSFMLVILFQIVFGFLGMIVVAAYSRRREFSADKGGAKLAGRPKMISALEALKGTTSFVDTQHESLAAFKISGKPGKFAALFSTHPALDERILRLKQMV
jgi:heat shock protein HtpX